MQPKPAHLESKYGAQFKDGSVAAAYRYRPAYPDETFRILSDLLPATGPRTVLDAGCGTGFVARPLAALVERVKAIDFSEAMIAEGRRLPGGDTPNLRWIVAPIETAPLNPPYGLVVAGSSVHWMDWPVVFPRFREALAPGAYMAVVEERTSPLPWRGALQPVIERYSTNRDYAPYDLIGELRQRGHLDVVGVRETEQVPFAQSVAEYVESFHARNGFSRDRMTPESAAAFDREACEVVSAFCPDGVVRLEVSAQVTWGLALG